MSLVKKGSGVVNDVCARVFRVNVMLGGKNSEYRMARHATGVGVDSGEAVCVCFKSASICVFACK